MGSTVMKQGWKHSSKIIDRISIEAPMVDRLQVIDWMYDKGYRSIRSGPKMISYNKADSTIFHVVAEKEM